MTKSTKIDFFFESAPETEEKSNSEKIAFAGRSEEYS